MRKLKLQIQMTIDGFIAGENGEMDWVCFDWGNDIKEYVTTITDPVDAILLGRNLAQGFIPNWAAILEEDGAAKINSTKKYVFTKTITEADWTNTALVNGDFINEIQKLKNGHRRS